MKTWTRLCFFVAALSGLAANAALLDHYSPPHRVLDHLIAPLHAHSIDVARDPNVAHLSTSPAVVTLLSGKRAGEVPNEAWVADFKRGSAGAVLGVRAPASGEFFKSWSNAKPERRVFIAFTRADAPLAGHVKESLADAGYVPFVYLSDEHAQPTLKPEEVGRLFAEAEHRLIVQTPRTDKSKGVAVERAMAVDFEDYKVQMRNQFALLRADAGALKTWEDAQPPAAPLLTEEQLNALWAARASIRLRVDGFEKRMETVGGLQSALGGRAASTWLRSVSPDLIRFYAPPTTTAAVTPASFDGAHRRFGKSFGILTKPAYPDQPRP